MGFKRDGVVYEFHHLGIPTSEPKPGERYSELFAMHTADSPCQTVRTQFHRFEPGSSMHPLIRTLPHVAFKVSSLEQAIVDCHVILGPYEPIPGFRVAIIDDGGHPVEFLETNLSDDEIWARAEGEDNLLYSSDPEATANIPGLTPREY